MWSNRALKETFFILRVIPCSILQSSGVIDSIPKSFMKVVSLVEIGLEKVLTHLTGALPGKHVHVHV